MSRKQFIEAQGATCRNWRNSWAFVNHEEKFIIFGAWDVNTTPEKAMIFTMDWERGENGRKSPAFGEALEYIDLIEISGYALKTFPIIREKEHGNKPLAGTAHIKDHIEELTDAELVREENEFYAIAHYKSEHAKKESTGFSNDVEQIFESVSDKTERESLVMARIGQGKFRKNVISLWGNGECCALTLVSIREMLIASHILPWSKCETNDQRLDGSNGILLCAHIDKLFDNHLITFKQRGSRLVLEVAAQIDKNLLKQLGIDSGQELCTDSVEPHFFQQISEYLLKHNAVFTEKQIQ
ncbi:MAG: HNH endonuclease [Glaciecola sp.]